MIFLMIDQIGRVATPAMPIENDLQAKPPAAGPFRNRLPYTAAYLYSLRYISALRSTACTYSRVSA